MHESIGAGRSSDSLALEHHRIPEINRDVQQAVVDGEHVTTATVPHFPNAAELAI